MSERSDHMLVIIFMFAMLCFVCKLFVFGLKVALELGKILVKLLFFPLMIIGFLCLVAVAFMGLISLALPFLIIAGIVALSAALIGCIARS